MKYLHGIGGLIILFLAFYVGRSTGLLFAWEAVSRTFNDQVDLPEMILILMPFMGLCFGIGHILFGFSKRNIWTSISLVLIYVTVIFTLLALMSGVFGEIGIMAFSIAIPLIFVLSALFFIVGIITHCLREVWKTKHTSI